jgi:putative glutamine amidotransferase
VIVLQVKIGITSGWEPGTVVEGWPLTYVNKNITECIEEAGAIPVIIPVLENEELIDRYMGIIDGIVVSGEVLSIKRNVVKAIGKNILQNSNPLRYKNELAVIKAAKKFRKPLLGICRGLQVLTIVEGGSVLDDDINVGNDIIHQQGGIKPPDAAIHSIRIAPESKLWGMLKRDHLMVNSFHRQALESVPDGYIASAVADDGNIEAIETKGNDFIMGLQFHPEMLKEDVWKGFFKEFISVVKEHNPVV